MFATPAVAGDLVYIGSCSGSLFALDRATGRPRWSHDVRHGDAPVSFHGDALVTDSTLIIGTDGGSGEGPPGEVYAFDLGTGRVRWRRGTTAGIVSDVVRAGERVLVSTRDDSLLCLDARDGRLVWSFRGGEPFQPVAYRSPAVAGGRVFFAGADGVVRALDAASGRVLWTRDLGGRATTGVLALGEALFVGTADGEFYRLGQARGVVEARLAIGHPADGPPVAIGDSLIVLGGERSLTAVDAGLRRVRWHRGLPDPRSSSRPYLWRGLVLAGTEQGELLALRAGDGLPRWSRTLSGVLRGIGTSERVLYVGTLKGTVHAYARSPSAFGDR